MHEAGEVVVVFSGGGTGGHLYPSLALARALEDLRPDVRPFFVGARRGLEARVYPLRGVEHVLLPVRGLRRDSLLGNVEAMGALTRSLGQVAELYQGLRPEAAVVTGGYAGGPAGILAGLRGIPLVLQEQNAVPGVTTRYLSRIARQIHVAFPEAAQHLPARLRSRIRVSGNPIEPPVRIDNAEARRHFELSEEGLVALVVGGSQGSATLNLRLLEAIHSVLDGLLPKPPGLQLLWATGPTHIVSVTAALYEMGSPEWVRPIGYIDEMPLALASADFAVSRAGAMATSEFLAWGLPSILIPLPTAAANHQERNARALEKAGAAVHLPERGLEAEELWLAMTMLAEDQDRRLFMHEVARMRGRPRAAEEIARAVALLLPPPAVGGRRGRGRGGEERWPGVERRASARGGGPAGGPHPGSEDPTGAPDPSHGPGGAA